MLNFSNLYFGIVSYSLLYLKCFSFFLSGIFNCHRLTEQKNGHVIGTHIGSSCTWSYIYLYGNYYAGWSWIWFHYKVSFHLSLTLFYSQNILHKFLSTVIVKNKSVAKSVDGKLDIFWSLKEFIFKFNVAKWKNIILNWKYLLQIVFYFKFSTFKHLHEQCWKYWNESKHLLLNVLYHRERIWLAWN
jgi:hypothetical protein